MSIATEITRLQTAKADLKTSIEAKGVTVASDAKLDAYPALVDSIPSGGGSGGAVTEKLLNFYDYEGTLVASFAASEIAGLASLPDAPDHSTDEVPLTFDGWNWTLAQIQSHHTDYPDGIINVGANYHTTDGKTHAFFNITTDKDGNGVWFNAQASGTVDWGDGSATESFSAGDVYHVYTSAGLFHCVIDSTSAYIGFGKSSTSFRKYITKVQGVYYPNTVTSIGSSAFQNCYALQSITIPDSVTSIGTNAFSSCYNLQSIMIPDGVTSIGSSAFLNCSALQSIMIPDGVTSIGGSAFQNCSALQSITIPSGVTSIGGTMFQNCSALQSIMIPSGVTSIGGSAFSDCSALQSITIPSSVTSIDGSAFYSCYALQSITIPDGVTSIGGSTFYNCYALQSITIPSSVTSIGGSAFSGCCALQSITIPSSVTSIGNSAFQNCYALYTVILEPTTPPTLSSANAFSTSYQQKIIVPAGTLTAYQAATNWRTFASIMEEATA
jgi:hypothetical protein